MSDIITQYLTRTIANGGTTAQALAADADYIPVADVTRTMLWPVGSLHCTAGLGYVSGVAGSAWQGYMCTADIVDANTITFQRSTAVSTAVRAGVAVVEYVGHAGGPNEFIRRHKETITLAAASLTVDSGNITGFTDINKCLPQVFARTDHNSNAATAVMLRWEIVDVSGDKRVRITRGNSTSNLTIVVYVTELTGSNWSYQAKAHTFTASATNEDETITSMAAANTALFHGVTHAAGGGASRHTVLVRQTSATNLRFRTVTAATTNCIAHLVSNSQIAVEHLGVPDGTNDWTASQGEVTVTLTNERDSAQSAVIIQAGSDSTDPAENPCGLWDARFGTSGTVNARRTRLFGGTEYVLQSVSFESVASAPRVDAVTTIQNGASFTITGTQFKPAGTHPTVTLGGVAQTVTASSATSITATGARGTLKYGQLQALVVTNSAGAVSPAFDAAMQPQDDWNFVDLGPLALAGQRITATADLAAGDQLAWGNVVGGAIEDVTVEADASFFADDDVLSFDVEANDGTGWGATAEQGLEDPGSPPTFGGPIPDYNLYVGIPVQVNFGHFAAGQESVQLLGTLPDGLTEDDGVMVGFPTTEGISSITVRYTNAFGDTDSNAFQLIVLFPNLTRRRVRIERIRRT